MADPDPMTCDPGSRVYDPDPGTVIPDPIYLVTTLINSVKIQMHLNVALYFLPFLFKIQQAERLVWLVSSAGRGWEWVGLPTSCSATFWQLLVFRATFCILSKF